MKKKITAILFTCIFIILGGAHAFADASGTDLSPYKSPIQDTLGDMMGEADQDNAASVQAENFIFDVNVDREAGTAEISYSAKKSCPAVLNVYNDYESEAEKELLATVGPFTLTAGGKTLSVEFPASVPEFFELEAVVSTDEGEAGFKSSKYTADISFAENATEKDFPEGYYVSLGQTSKNSVKLFAKGNQQETENETEGYIAYNRDLILLDEDADYSIKENGGKQQVVFSTLPEEVKGMTEEELESVAGFVIRGENPIDDDVFFLNDGMTLTGNGLAMNLREPEDIDELYESINMTLTASSPIGRIWLPVFSEYASGRIAYDPLISLKLVKHSWKIDCYVTLTNGGAFELELKKTFSSNYPSLDPIPQGIKNLKDIIPDLRYTIYGVGASLQTDFEISASNDAYVSGEYGLVLYVSAGFSGFSYGFRQDSFYFDEVTPHVANVPTYVYLARTVSAHLEGLVFDFKIFTIGPVFDAAVTFASSGRAIATLEKDVEYAEDADCIHACCTPGKKGCISGFYADAKSLRIEFTVDLFFWDKTWRVPIKTWADYEPDGYYFHRSLEYGDGETRYGVETYCPHSVYRITVRTTENVIDELAGSVISGSTIATEYSNLVTDVHGNASRVYLPVPANGEDQYVSAVDSENKEIGTQAVTLKDVVLNKTIVIDRNATVIDAVDILGSWFPRKTGDKIYAGTNVNTSETTWHYYQSVFLHGSKYNTNMYGIPTSVRWNDWYPEGEESGYADEKIMRCTITMDFSAYGDGTARLSATAGENTTILGSKGGNPVYDSDYNYYRFVITDAEVSDKVLPDGTVRPNAILTVQAEFLLPEDDDNFVLVTVDNGLNSVKGHFYPAGAQAVAIGKDIGDTKRTLVYDFVPKLDLSVWSGNEKEALKNEIWNASASEKTFDYWYVFRGSLTYPDDFSPLVTEDGEVSYNAVVFTVPDNVREVILEAKYGGNHEIETVYAGIKAPVPGEFLSQDDYQTAALSTEPGDCVVRGVEGEAAGTVNLYWETDSAEVSGRIRYNTDYVVYGTVEPDNKEDANYWRFRYPLGSEEGTRAFIVSGDSVEEAMEFNLEGDTGTEEELPVIAKPKATFKYVFTTPKALLLEILPNEDLYFPEGTSAKVINAVLQAKRAGILTEDPGINAADATWEQLKDAPEGSGANELVVPAPGESVTVPGKVIVPDEIRNEDVPPEHKKVEETTSIVVHIVPADELMPPEADPAPGVYNEDIVVKLTTREKDAGIEYYIEEDGTVFASYDNPIELNRAALSQKEYTIVAKTVKDGKESVEVTFRYILQPSENEYRLLVKGGKAYSIYGNGSDMYIPSHAAVMLEPEDNENGVFDHWQVDEAPVGFAWDEGTGEETENATFIMPAGDVTLTAVYQPADGKRIITEIRVIGDFVNLNQESLPEGDFRSTIAVHAKIPGKSPDMSVTLWDCTKFTWDNNTLPVTYGTYTLNAPYSVEELAALSMADSSISYDRKLKEEDVFSPGLQAKYNEDKASVIVSPDGKRAIVSYSFTFEPEYYVVKYDANGGSLGNVPAQVVELTTVKTELTSEKPVRSDGGLFLGWSTDPEAEEPEYIYKESKEGEPPVENPKFKKDITLYAVWAKTGLEVRWLDSDNAKKTRGPVTITVNGTEIKVDPSEAVEQDGVGINRYAVKSGTEEIGVQVAGEKDGHLKIEDGGLYSVVTEVKEDGKVIVTLLAVREFKAVKEWDIDFEGKDHPESVKMILQSGTKPADMDSRLIETLLAVVSDPSAENRDAVIAEIEKMTGYSLKGLTPKAAASKVMTLIANNKLSGSSLTDILKSLLKADTDDSSDGSEKWYAVNSLKLSSENSWKATFPAVPRFKSKTTVNEDGSLKVEWNGEERYRIREKSGKAPVEDGKDAVFEVKAYTNLAGKTVDDHKTVYIVKYKTDGDTTTVTNTAVEDHSIWKKWVMLGEAKKPENVYVLLLWKYDEDYLNAAGKLIDIDLNNIWLPETKPISGKVASLGDVMKSLGLDIPIITDLADMVKIPLAIAKLNEKNSWQVSFRVKKYGNFGIPQVHQAGELFSALVQDVISYFAGFSFPVGINPLQGFISVSVPEVDVPLTTTKLDAVVNTWYKGDDDDPDDPDDDSHVISGTKIWKDNGNEKGLRPEAVTIHILEDGKYIGVDITVKSSDAGTEMNDAGIWPWTYKNDSIDTKKHTYSVTEDAVPGYKTEYDGLNVINTYDTTGEKVVVEVLKSWDEETATEHDPVTVTVLANGSAYRDVVLSKDSDWKTVLSDCPKADSEGNVITYTVEEKDVPEGYTVSYECHKDEAGNFRCYVTNTPVPAATVRVVKVWEETGKQKIAHEPVTVNVYRNGEPFAAVTLSEDNSWEENLGSCLLTDSEGNAYEFTAKEEPEVAGYTVSYDSAEDGEGNITLTVKNTAIAPVVLKGRKIWNDESNRYGARPDQVIVHLYEDDDEVTSFVLNSGNDWRWEYEVTPEEAENAIFTITEDEVANYKAEYDGLNVKNTYIETVSVHVVKVWDEAAAQEHDPVTVHILKDGSIVKNVTLSAENGWETTVTNLERKNVYGSDAVYYVEEEPVPENYSVSYDISFDETKAVFECEVKNTPVPADKKELKGRKIWQDNENEYSFRPASVSVTLLKDGMETASFDLSDENAWSWSYLIDALEDTESYSVIEKDEPEGYTASYDGLNVTNTLQHNETITIVVVKNWNEKKVWDDNPDAGHDSVTVEILADGEAYDTVTLGNGNGWRTELDDCPKYSASAEPIEYTVRETPVPVYYTDGYEKSFDSETGTLTFTVINTPETTEISGRKIWDDNDDEARLRPENVTVHLSEDGHEIGSFVLNEDNCWTWSLALSAKDAAERTFTVREDSVSGYITTYDGLNVINTLRPVDPNGIDVLVKKVWEGTDETHPAVPVSIQLKRNGEDCEDPFVLSGDNGWEYLFTGIAASDADDEPYKYTAIEESVPAGFGVSYAYAYDAEKKLLTITVTNKCTGADEIVIGGEKIWDDEDDILGLRPDSVTFDVLANGTAVDRHVLSRGTEWKWSGTYPKTDEDRKEIMYSVCEMPVSFYHPAYSDDDLSVTNSLKPVGLEITKRWNDNDDENSLRPDSISGVVYMRPEGSDTAEEYTSVTVSADEGWKKTIYVPFDDSEGRKLLYTFEEVVPSDYTVSYDEPAYDADASLWKLGLCNSLASRLTVRKTVLHGDEERKFTFHITLLDNEGAPFNGTLETETNVNGSTETSSLEFSNGMADFELADGEYVTFTQVPYLYHYKITEDHVLSYETWCVDSDNEADKGEEPPAGSKAMAAPPEKGSHPDYTEADKLFKDSEAVFYNDASITVKGRKTIDGRTPSASEEELFTFELLDSKQNPVLDEYGEAVTAVNGENGTFELTAAIEVAAGDVFYVREKEDKTLEDAYLLDNSLYQVIVGADDAGNVVLDPAETVINNRVLTEITVEKQWIGEDKGAVELELYENGVLVEDALPVRENNVYRYEKLLKCDTDGKEIARFVKEKVPAGYIALYSNTGDYADKTDAAYDGGLIINCPSGTVVVKKVWEEKKAKDHEPVSVTVLRNGETYAAVTLKAENGWEETLTDCPLLDMDGKAYEYTVTEPAVPEGYQESYNSSFNADTSTFTLTVTNKLKDIVYTGSKVWDDEDNLLGVRPGNVTFTILANGKPVDEKILSADSGWTWNGSYPKEDEDGDIVYTVEEKPVPYYTPVYSDDGLSVTNIVDYVTLEIVKNWDDNEDEGGARPDTVTVTILRKTSSMEEPETYDTATFGGTGSTWTYSVKALRTDEYGEAYAYSVSEVPGFDYTASFAEPAYDEASRVWTLGLTNTAVSPLLIRNRVVHGNPDTAFVFTVTLVDEEGASFTGDLAAELTAGGETVTTTVTFADGKAQVSLKSGESVNFLKIPTGWRYTVNEAVPFGYVAWCVDTDNEAEPPALLMAGTPGGGDPVPPKGTHPDYTTALKPFRDSLVTFYNDAGFTLHGRKTVDGKAPSEEEEGLFTFGIYDSAMNPVLDEYGEPVTAVNGDNGLFTLTAYREIQEGDTFYIREVDDAGLKKQYVLDTSAHKVTLTAGENGETVENPTETVIDNATLTTLTVYKEWVGEDQGAVILDLYENGELVPGAVPKREGNTYTFEGLRRFDEKGREILRYVKEEEMEGYIPRYRNVGDYSEKSGAAYDGGTIVNRPSVIIGIRKVWKGHEEHPSTVTIDIYQDGEFYRTVTKTPDADGNILFELLEFNVKEKAVYTFIEQEPANWEASYSNEDPHAEETGCVYANGTITNTYRKLPPPTGDNTPLALMTVASVLSLLALAAFPALKKRFF